MLRLGERIVIVADAFEQGLPIGDYGYLIAYDRNPDNAFDYVIRVPQANRNFYVTAEDVETEEQLLAAQAESATHEALIDYALSTHNEKLFHHLMNGGDVEAVETETTTKESLSQADFIKQVNLRAWI
ncbi:MULTISPECIES: hypothetical protein [Paenibacillus sonchi group]|uniref:ATPase n=2 Tax=Paenibacillus riograndensis TaxID=483937 RepID=A0A132U2R2_9BACL|nr:MULTISPECIES: hypothetical protein [Paenibacillus sonchi group]KWX77854.1 ATPase [Paenibacillus riograndensis]KWX82826.1 ATPase [Paenibacillus riograndensis]MCE3203221.1 ATPase [Paenibacillus sonchi]CQR58247.1 hypothetical protein PRIO_5878 [Paenibacillus riograndensis SBR5]